MNESDTTRRAGTTPAATTVRSMRSTDAERRETPCAPPLGDFPFDDQGAGYDAEAHHRRISACVERERSALSRIWTTRADFRSIVTNAAMGPIAAAWFGVFASATALLAFKFAVDVRAEELTPPSLMALWGYLCDRSIGFTVSALSLAAQAIAISSVCVHLRRRRDNVAREVAHALEHVLNDGALTSWIIRLQGALKILNLGDAPDVEYRQSAVAAYHAQWYWRLIDRLATSFSFDWRHFKEEATRTRHNYVVARNMGVLMFVALAVAVTNRWIALNDYDVADYFDLAVFATLNWSASATILIFAARSLARSRNEAVAAVELALYGGAWVDPHEAKGSKGDPLTPRERQLAALDPFPLLIRRYRYAIQEKHER